MRRYWVNETCSSCQGGGVLTVYDEHATGIAVSGNRAWRQGYTHVQVINNSPLAYESIAGYVTCGACGGKGRIRYEQIEYAR